MKSSWGQDERLGTGATSIPGGSLQGQEAEDSFGKETSTEWVLRAQQHGVQSLDPQETSGSLLPWSLSPRGLSEKRGNLTTARIYAALTVPGPVL